VVLLCVVGKIGGLQEGGDQNGIIDQTKCRKREKRVQQKDS